MTITHSIRAVQAHFMHLPRGSKFVLGIQSPGHFEDKLKKIGFTFPLNPGDSILPAAKFGKACRVNSEGWIEKHTDQPKETCYHTRVHTWRMKRGYGYEEDSKIVSMPYQRYPRTEHAPYGMELSVTPIAGGGQMLTLSPMVYGETSDHQIKTAVNFLVELFGECEVFTASLEKFLNTELRRLNWEVLPAGKMPWAVMSKHLEPVLAGKGAKVREICSYRFERINSYQPSFAARGRHGFHGYVVFGFPEKGIYIMESSYSGNATYVVGENWEKLSQMTKAEILTGKLHQARLVHTVEWAGKLHKLFQKDAAA